MFDPYYKWLGIPPKDQPPTHYRLLGVDIFEQDLDVIEGAADRLMGFVRQYQSGEHAADATRILNELAKARMCLLKPEKKAEYDTQLRKKQTEDVAGSKFADLDFSFSGDLKQAPAITSRVKSAKPARSNSGVSPRLLIVGGGAAACLFLVIVLIFALNRSSVRKPVRAADVAAANAANPDVVDAQPKTSTSPVPPQNPIVWQESTRAPEAAGEPVHLLAAVELSRDVVSGDWQQQQATLIGSSGSKIYLPTALPDDYRLKFRIRRLEKTDSLSIGFMMAGRQGVLCLDADGATTSGLFVDAQDPRSNCTLCPGKLLQDRTPVTVKITAHPGHLHAALGDQTIVDWFGDPQRLFVPDSIAVPCRETPFIAIADAKFEIESVELIPLQRELLPPRVTRLEQAVDILPLIEIDRDVIRGVWGLAKNSLSSPEGIGKIYLPTEVPEEYTLSVEVELSPQQQGAYNLVFGAKSGRSNFLLTTTNEHTGIDLIDGLRCNANETVLAGRQLTPGKPAQIDWTVTRDAIRMEIDGKTLIDWHGDDRRLSIPSDWALPDARRLFIGSAQHFKFRNIKLGPPIPAPKLPQHPPLSIGKPIDLLSMIDPVRDAYGGTWERHGVAIQCKGDTAFNKLAIPFDVPTEYALRFRISRTQTGGRQNEVLYVGLPTEQSNLLLMFDANGSSTNLAQIDEAISFSTGAGPVIPNGVTREITVALRKTGLKIQSDGMTILDWTGNSNRFRVLPNCVAPGRRISLGSWNQGFRFEKLEVTPLDSTSFPDIDALPDDGKLLPVINADRDSRKGNWKLDREFLTATASPDLARLKIPATVPEQYVFSANVERQQGRDELLIGLPIGKTACTLGIDAVGGHQTGVGELDGKRFVDNSNLLHRTYDQPLLPQNQIVPIRCVVLRDTIIVSCGNAEIIRWHGDSRRLSVNNEYSPTNPSDADCRHLWVGCWRSQFVFRDLVLKSLSDTEAEEISNSFSGVFPATSQSNVPLSKPKIDLGQPQVETSVDDGEKHWLLPRKSTAKLLAIVLSDQTIEWDAVIDACRHSKLPFHLVPSFPEMMFDYSQFSLIIVGTNAMDEWGQPERKDPSAFQSVEAFVKGGGHMLVFNAFNGRNMEQLRRFGIQTGTQHATTYQSIAGLTEVVFDGSERLIPEGNYLRQAGNYTVDRPHLDLLRRGDGMGDGAVVTTIPYGAGRVTYSSVEPGFGEPPGHWLVQVLIRWAARGAPVSSADLAAIAQAASVNQSKTTTVNSPKLTILEAKYGAGGKLTDVTQTFAAAAKNGLLLATIDGSLAEDNSASGQVRYLHLRYKLNGLEEFQKIAENRSIQIDARPSSTTKFSKNFKLVEARWGAGIFNLKSKDLWVNVAEQIKPFAKDNGLRMSREKSIAILNALPDPRPGVVKTLLIQYQYQGEEHFALYPGLQQPIALGAAAVEK